MRVYTPPGSNLRVKENVSIQQIHVDSIRADYYKAVSYTGSEKPRITT